MSSDQQGGGWCCIQAGHRERYAVPRALHQVGRLDRLLTDLWLEPGSWLSALPLGGLGRRMRDRYSSGLPPELVFSPIGRTLAWELGAAARRLRGNELTAARMRRWTALAARTLAAAVRPTTGFVFGYCYEAAAVFEAARVLGLSPILGQIDPGPGEDRKVTEIVRRWPAYRTPFQPGTAAYYASWRRECSLAKHVVVNSEWSRRALVEEGIDPGKVAVIPLVYDAPPEALSLQRTYPRAFAAARPLRVLFLGQCILRKGIAELIAAAQSLADEPIEFTFVGNTDIADFPRHFGRARIRYVPRVSRAECHDFYRAADIFLFPTHSDGFGLTQLEAQAWKLPIVASRFCAEVVRDRETGLVLDQVAPEPIRAALLHAFTHPGELAMMADGIRPWPFDLQQLGLRLGQLAAAPLSAPAASPRSRMRHD